MSDLVTAPTEHGEGCGCTGCVGFLPGNQLGATHECYSMRMAPRAAEIAEGLVPLVPFYLPAHRPLVDLASFALAQVERAGLVLAIEQAESQRALAEGRAPSPRLDRLAADSRAWVGKARQLLDDLGCTPSSRARILRDAGIGRAAAAQAAVRDLSGLEAEGRKLRLAAEAS